jgi:hypothetical protein
VQEGRWYQGIASAGRVFALAFFVCVVVAPIASLFLGFLFRLEPLVMVAMVPVYALWLGDLYFGRGDPATWSKADGYHAIPLVVWLVTWVAFALAARKLGGWGRAAAAVVVIVGVAVGLYLALDVLGIRLFMDSL